MTGRLAYHNLLGTKNQADILTKHVPAELLSRHIGTLHMAAGGGRAKTAPELNSLVSVLVAWEEGEN